MIGYLRGTILDIHGSEVWLDVQGVGYRVHVGKQGVGSAVGSDIALYIHTAVKEDAITLYGFADYAALRLFELVISVSGVGPKIGMAIVGGAASDTVERAIRDADVAFFQSIPGIGKKGAQRIIVDLKSKIGSFKDVDLADGAGDDVVEALKQFGFKEGEIMAALSDLDRSMSVEDQVRAGLKRLGKR